MLNIIGRGTTLVTGIVGGKRRDGGRGIVQCPCLEHTVTLVATCVGDAVEVGLELLVVVDVNTANTLEEHREVEILVVKRYIQTPREIWHRIEDPSLVVGIDTTVAIEVGILQTSYACVLLTACKHFLTVLIESVNNLSYD